MKKKCTKCKQEKEYSRFNTSKRSKDGYTIVCIQCKDEKHMVEQLLKAEIDDTNWTPITGTPIENVVLFVDTQADMDFYTCSIALSMWVKQQSNTSVIVACSKSVEELDDAMEHVKYHNQYKNWQIALQNQKMLFLEPGEIDECIELDECDTIVFNGPSKYIQVAVDAGKQIVMFNPNGACDDINVKANWVINANLLSPAMT